MKIGLTLTNVNNLQKHKNYVNWLKENDDIEIITLSVGNKNAAAIADCDALVLSGGVDIYPEFYGSDNFNYPNHPSDGFQKARDEFEIKIFKSALEKKIPILGICRGLQLVNIILGGTLKQDIGEELNKIHQGDKNSGDKLHQVIINKDSLLYEIANIENDKVNSSHHQAIDQLGKNLMVNCRADDGTIEGIEWKDKSNKSFLLCVQWHPERMFQLGLQQNPLSQKIRDSFIEEIQKHKSVIK